MALTASAGWARSEARQLPTAFNRLDLWTYDAGVEARIAPPMSESMTFAPFVGIGAGARTYDYRDMDVDSETYMAGYGALGGEVGYKSMGIRLEARDYLSRFRLPSGERDTRNDLTLSAALNLRIW
jgi:hypothetical protein